MTCSTTTTSYSSSVSSTDATSIHGFATGSPRRESSSTGRIEQDDEQPQPGLDSEALDFRAASESLALSARSEVPDWPPETPDSARVEVSGDNTSLELVDGRTDGDERLGLGMERLYQDA